MNLAQLESRILILTAAENEGASLTEWLGQAGLEGVVCSNSAQVAWEYGRGGAAIVLAEEVLDTESISPLLDLLAHQPTWSDLPVVVLTWAGDDRHATLRRAEIFRDSGHLSLMQRPLRADAMVSLLEVALRARRKQYQTRGLLQHMHAVARKQEAESRMFDATLSSITDLAYTFDLEGNWIYANKPLLELWGKSLGEIIGRSSLELGYDPELATRLKSQVQEVVATRKPIRGETYFTSAAGVEDYHEYIFSPVFAPNGTVAAVTGTTRLSTERKKAEALAESQRRVLQLIAENRPLAEILDSLARAIEIEGSVQAFACIHLLDSDGIHLRHGAAPTLPVAVREVLADLPIGPHAGSTGTAAFTRKLVQIQNIAIDARCGPLKAIALQHGIHACWSLPILSTQAQVLGTVSVFYTESRKPTDMDIRLGEMASRTAAIAIARKLGDIAIRESQQRYHQLVQALPTAVYTTDVEGYLTLFNEAAATLWGRTPEIGKDRWTGSWRTYLPDGNRLPDEQLPMARALREGRAIRGQEVLVERPDGTRRSVVPYPDPIRDEAGRVIGAVNMLLDITETKRADEVSRRLAAIVESSDDAIISKDLNGLITSWNRGAERLFGYEASEVLGKPITILMLPEQYGDEPKILARIRRGEHIEHYETIRRRRDGSQVEISLTISPMKNAEGKIFGASKIVRDITKQKQSERNLEQAHQEVLAASRAKDDFLAALSHELRTPLNPVLLLASEGADDRDLPAHVRARFLTIRNNVELEARLIDDLLDITRITHGKLSMNLETVNVHAALAETIATVKAEIALKRIVLSTQLSAPDPLVRGDAVRLQQVFWNVIKNAIKFTPDGGRVAITTHQVNQDNLIIVVADTGIGMTEAELARAFEAFSQGEHLNEMGSHRFGGLGLGLAITRKLVELHSGTITAQSQGKGQGSTFSISLPVGYRQLRETTPLPASLLPSFPAEPPSRGDRRILLVEDHEPTRTALAQLLKRRGYEIQAAGTLAQARALAELEAFQLLISDIDLPDGTGFELIAELRKRNQDLQGIALTGYGMESDLAKTKAAGFSVHLIKPVRMQSLELALTKLSSPEEGIPLDRVSPSSSQSE